MTPSLPGMGLITRHIVHCPLGEFPSAISAMWFSFRGFAFWVHCSRVISRGTYSRIQRRKISSARCWAARQSFLDASSPSSKMSGGMCGLRGLAGSGKVICSGSVGSTLMCVRGRAFKNASTSAISVDSVSSVVIRSFNTAYSARFADWMGRSQTPPKCGPAGGEKRQSILKFVASLVMSFSPRFQATPATPFLPLSGWCHCRCI